MTRVDVCDRATQATRHQRPRIQGSRNRDGIQTHRGCTSPLAGRERTAPCSTRPRRSHLHQRQTRRTRHRNSPKGGSRLKEPHPQVLTITHEFDTRPLLHKTPVDGLNLGWVLPAAHLTFSVEPSRCTGVFTGRPLGSNGEGQLIESEARITCHRAVYQRAVRLNRSCSGRSA